MRVALLALLVMTLAACEAFPPGAPRGGRMPDQPEPETAQAADTDSAPPAKAEPAPLPPRPPQVPHRGSLDTGRLTGLTPDRARELLGPPTEIQQEAPATVWIYQLAGCRLELFFYLDLESQEQKTLTLDLDPGDARAGSPAFCLRTLAERGRRLPAPAPEAGAAGRTQTAGPGARGQTDE